MLRIAQRTSWPEMVDPEQAAALVEPFLRARDVAERAAGGGARLVRGHPLLDQACGLDVHVRADFAREVLVPALLG